MKTIKLFLLLLSFFMLGSCREFFDIPRFNFQYITFVNNSDTYVSFYPYSFSWAILDYGRYYPDTLLPPADTGYRSIDSDQYKVLPMKSYTLNTKIEKNSLKENPNRKCLLMFYVFSVDTLEKYSWEEIREGYKILKRYDLSYDDMDSLNWTITYP